MVKGRSDGVAGVEVGKLQRLIERPGGESAYLCWAHGARERTRAALSGDSLDRDMPLGLRRHPKRRLHRHEQLFGLLGCPLELLIRGNLLYH